MTNRRHIMGYAILAFEIIVLMIILGYVCLKI